MRLSLCAPNRATASIAEHGRTGLFPSFYREKLERVGVNPDSITGLKDISRLPFTTKDELRQTYPYGLLACDPADLVEIHTSSGTTGTPVVGAYTEADIDM